MYNSEEIFKEKAEFNKWLKELTKEEKELIIDMLDVAYNEGFSSGIEDCNDRE